MSSSRRQEISGNIPRWLVGLVLRGYMQPFDSGSGRRERNELGQFNNQDSSYALGEKQPVGIPRNQQFFRLGCGTRYDCSQTEQGCLPRLNGNCTAGDRHGYAGRVSQSTDA